MALIVKTVNPGAIPVIQQLVNITWPATYGSILSPGQLDYMLQLIYSDQALQDQFTRGHHFIICYDDGQPVGFASFGILEEMTDVVKLHKLYVLPNQQGKGIGRLLIEQVKQEIEPLRRLQLNVNRHNKALHFYTRSGFNILREEDINIGHGYFMNDYIMELSW